MRDHLSIVAALMILATGPLQAADSAELESNRRDDVFYSEEEARDRVFGESLAWQDTVIHVDSSARASLHQAAGLVESDTVVRIWFVPGDDGVPQVVYRVASEVGKHNPFDFLVGLNRERKVEGIVILNYREARGGDVRRARFLRQFEGKALSDAVSVNRDIIGISGATLSSRAVTRGVRKTLWWVAHLWPEAGEVSR